MAKLEFVFSISSVSNSNDSQQLALDVSSVNKRWTRHATQNLLT